MRFVRLPGLLLSALLLPTACDGGDDRGAAAADARPADGTERGNCYGNGTCNDGLVCLSNLCVKPDPGKAPEAAPAAPVVPTTPANAPVPPANPPDAPPAEAPGEPPGQPPAEPPDAPPAPADAPPPAPAAPRSLEDHYLGTHWLAVNRVGDSVRSGRATVKRRDGKLFISGSVKKGPFDLALEGEVIPISKKEFDLKGTISGTPDMDWAGEPRKHRETRGTFRFRAKGARKYWRMYVVNGKDCVCHDGCGNDFCYIDVGFLK